MHHINITDQIHRIHNNHTMDKIVAETIKPKIFDYFDITKFSSCISVKMREKIDAFVCIANVELLSTSNNTKMKWHSHSINFESAGFFLDIRRVIGSDSDVDLYFRSNGSSVGEMSLLLDKYANREFILEIKNNERLILEALIYVDELAMAAEGNGKLVPINQDNDISGNVSINIKIA